jgi:hypothetical protein
MPKAKSAKTRLISLQDLDRRTAAYRQVSSLAAAIEADLGGDLSKAQREVVEAAALLGAVWRDLAAHWFAGDAVDPGQLVAVAAAQRKHLWAGLPLADENSTK